VEGAVELRFGAWLELGPTLINAHRDQQGRGVCGAYTTARKTIPRYLCMGNNLLIFRII